MIKKHKSLFFVILLLAIAYPVFMLALPGCGGGGGFSVTTTGVTPTLTPTNTSTPSTPQAPSTNNIRYAYIAAYADNEIIALNPDSTETKTITGLSSVRSMCFSNTKRINDLPKYLYVANGTNVRRVNLETQQLDSSWVADSNAILCDDVAMSKDDKFLYSVNDIFENKIIVTNLDSLQETSISFNVYRILDFLLTNDGQYGIAILMNFVPDSIAIIKTSDNSVYKTINLAPDCPAKIALGHTNNFAYILTRDQDNDKILVMDTTTFQIVNSLIIAPANTAYQIAVTPDDKFAYIAMGNQHNVSILELNGSNITLLPDKITVTDEIWGWSPRELAISSDGKYLWTYSPASHGTIKIFKISDNSFYNEIHQDVNPNAPFIIAE